MSCVDTPKLVTETVQEEECRTEEDCEVSPEKKCEVEMKDVCSTTQERQCEVKQECNTVHDEVCETKMNKECRMVDTQVCSTTPQQECKVMSEVLNFYFVYIYFVVIPIQTLSMFIVGCSHPEVFQPSGAGMQASHEESLRECSVQ